MCWRGRGRKRRHRSAVRVDDHRRSSHHSNTNHRNTSYRNANHSNTNFRNANYCDAAAHRCAHDGIAAPGFGGTEGDGSSNSHHQGVR